MGIVIKVGQHELPSPVELSTADEIIWSSNTGRSATGKMIGDVVAEKKTFEIRWGVLTKSQKDVIAQRLTSGFVSFQVVIDGNSTTIDVYRGTLNASLLGTYGGVTYYKEASVSVVQQ